MRKKKNLCITLLLSAAMVLSAFPDTGAAQAAAKVTLSRKSITLGQGKTTTLRLKNAKSKVKWSINKAKVAKLAKKNKNTVKILAKKAGTAKITAKAGQKKYTCKLTVKAKNTPGGQQTATPPAGNTAAPVKSNTPATGAPAGQTPTAPATTDNPPSTPVQPKQANGLVTTATSTSGEIQGISIYNTDNTHLIEVFGEFSDIREVFSSIRLSYQNDDVEVLSREYSPEAYFSDTTPGYYRIEVKGILDGKEVTQTYFLGRAGKFETKETDNGTIELGRYSGWAKTLAIPDVIDGKKVTHIGRQAFYRCTNMADIVIPDGVTTIGNNAFHGCDGLTSITIPGSVNSIGDSAFYYCGGLTGITVAANNTVYDSRNNCNAIIETKSNTLLTGCQNTTIPDSVTSIGISAFHDCSSLREISIPNNVTNIAAWTFSGCSDLTEIIIPDSVTSIGYGAFSDCSSLTEIIIPNSVTDIEALTFFGCSDLTSISIPDSVTSIGISAFHDCSSLTSIFIPGSVTDIATAGSLSLYQSYKAVFSGCNSLREITVAEDNPVYDSRDNCNAIIETKSNTLLTGCQNTTIPDNITNISPCAFFGCSSLREISIPDSVTNIGYYAFFGCSSLKEISIPDNVTNIAAWTFSGCSDLTEIIIPDSVTSIGYGAFSDCSSLTEIIIPNSVTDIEADFSFFSETRTFSGCSNLRRITVAKDNPIYDSRGNCNAIIETKSNTLLVGCQNTTIPNDITIIGISAFFGCSSLTNIHIPDSVTYIYQAAFKDCCSLTKITIPSRVACITENAFSGCSSLTEITVAKDNPVYDSRDNCNAIIETKSNTLHTGCQNTTIPDNVTNIGNHAFESRSSLTSISIPDSVTSIGHGAFSGCNSLNSIYIPDGVTSIKNAAFYGCSNLTSISIPDSVTSIGHGAFYGIPLVIYNGTATGSPWGAGEVRRSEE